MTSQVTIPDLLSIVRLGQIEISAEDSTFNDDNVDRFIEELLPHIDRLKISGEVTHVSPDGWQRLVEKLLCSGLEWVEFSYDALNNFQNATVLANTLRDDNCTTAGLRVNENSIPTEPLLEILEALKANHVVQDVILISSFHCAIESESDRLRLGRSLREQLQVNTTLRYLDLADNELPASINSELIIGLQSNTSLQLLKYDGNNLDDDNAIALSKLLRHNTSLKKLILKGFIMGRENDITERGHAALADCLKYNKSLTDVSIGINPGLMTHGL
jgi:Ran GTPase-activating protein (RanGAP) involved in mRNA processing and transport